MPATVIMVPGTTRVVPVMMGIIVCALVTATSVPVVVVPAVVIAVAVLAIIVMTIVVSATITARIAMMCIDRLVMLVMRTMGRATMSLLPVATAMLGSCGACCKNSDRKN